MYCSLHESKIISKIKKLNDTNLEKINEAKLKRLELDGANAHKEQVDSILHVINQDIHGVHLDQCYKR